MYESYACHVIPANIITFGTNVELLWLRLTQRFLLMEKDKCFIIEKEIEKGMFIRIHPLIYNFVLNKIQKWVSDTNIICNSFRGKTVTSFTKKKIQFCYFYLSF